MFPTKQNTKQLLLFALATCTQPATAIFGGPLPCFEFCGFFSVRAKTGDGIDCSERCIDFFTALFAAQSYSCGTCPDVTTTVTGTIAPTAPPVLPEAPVTAPAPTNPPTLAPTNPPTGPPIVPSGFNIDLDLVGVPDQDIEFFELPRQQWETIITGDISDFDSSFLPPPSLTGCSYPAVIDDTYMCGGYDSQGSDGVGGRLAFAFIEFVRAFDSPINPGLPINGVMAFDTADVPNLIAGGGFQNTILHEMGHLLGIGSLWQPLGIAGPDEDSCPYFGVNANREFQEISGCDAAPTETDLSTGPGTFCGHWSEVCMQNEFMTGFLDLTNPVSRVTIGSLQDIGWQVNYDAADEYGADDLGFCTCQLDRRKLRSEPPKRRRLSSEMHHKAISMGRTVLAQNAIKKSTMEEVPGAEYFGDKVVFIYMEEDGHIVGVPVVPEN